MSSRVARTGAVLALLAGLLVSGLVSPGVATAAGETMVASALTPNYANLGAAFNLAVTVTGAPAGPVGVTFSAPVSGPSGTFSNGYTSMTLMATADGSGSAINLSLPFTANDLAGAYSVTASLSGGGAPPVTFSLVNDGVSVAAGSPQTATLGTPFAAGLQVAVYSQGAAVAGAAVVFNAPTSGASGTFATTNAAAVTVYTNNSGAATAPAFTANDLPGTYSVVATSSAVAGSAQFSLTNSDAGIPATIVASQGSGQSAATGVGFTLPLTATVTDAQGLPVAGASVTFSVTPGSTGASASFVGSGSSVSETTNSYGVATTPVLTAGSAAGSFSVIGSVRGLNSTVTFSLAVTAGTPYTLTLGAGASQSAAVGTSFAVPLAVTVTDSHGNPVPGVGVTFTAPASGASGTFGPGDGRSVQVSTDSKGIAVAPTFVANGVAGGYIVTAFVAGISPAGAFTLVNDPPSSSTPPSSPPASPAVVAVATQPGGGGYWVVNTAGTVTSFGSAPSYGSLQGINLSAPVVGMSVTPDGGGYWLVASDGGIFSFGDAAFHGSAS